MSALTDAEFDALHECRDLLPIEQVAYESEGADRFAKFHSHGRTFSRVTTYQQPDESAP